MIKEIDTPLPDALVRRVSHSIVVHECTARDLSKLGRPCERFALKSVYTGPDGEKYVVQTNLPADCFSWDAPAPQILAAKVGDAYFAVTRPVHYEALWKYLCHTAQLHQHNLMILLFYGYHHG